MRKRYNKTYAKKWTKRELNRRVNMAWVIIILIIVSVIAQNVFEPTNDMTIPAKPEVIEELEFKPLAVEIDTPESKELAVKPITVKDLDPNRQEVKDYIVEATQGLNTDLYLRIADCESGFNPYAKNGISTASGVFQFIAGTWKYVNAKRGLDWTLDDRFDYKKNIDNAIWLMENEGATHWACYTCGML